MREPSLRHRRRRAKLQEIVDSFDGGASALAALLGTPKSHLSTLLAGRRGVGDQLAARVEGVLHKPPGWMDDAPATLVLTDEERDMVLALREARRARTGGAQIHHLPPQPERDGPGLLKNRAQKDRRSHIDRRRRPGDT